jgi:hypothetical protein
MSDERQALAAMISGYWISQAIHVAAKLGIADHLVEGPASAEKLAEPLGCLPEPLHRLLRALASIGVFSETDDGRFSLTPRAEFLRSDHPATIRPMAIMLGGVQYASWGELEHSLATGKTGFSKLYGQGLFDYLGEHPEEAAVFDAAMTSIHGAETQAAMEAYPLDGAKCLVDVGGGNGSQLAEMLEQDPYLTGVLFDLPHVASRAEPALKNRIPGRCEAVGGSFFESVPSGGDVYLLRHILHDWYDEDCLRILRSIEAVLPTTGRLLVIESVIRPGNEFDFGKWLDLTMLVAPGGKERTEAEFAALFAAANLKLVRVVPTKSPVSVLEVVRAT